MTATKEKRVKIREERPPNEIVSNTKARRAWLAEKLAAIKATPGLDGKIVGIGSYQVVSVYSVSQVSGRLRHRGNCQYCGASQVSDNGVMVLHGYKRPGDGELIGRCPGMSLPPLQISNQQTTAWLQQWTQQAADDAADVEVAEKAEDAAREARYGADGEDLEDPYTAHQAKPHIFWERATPEQKTAYMAAKKVWSERFPLTAAHERAKSNHSEARNTAWASESMRRHFQILLKMNLTGTPLIEEVVV